MADTSAAFPTGFEGKTVISMTVAVKGDMESLADEVFRKHKDFMKRTHHALGLLSYNVGKNKEFSNPMDPTSEPTGRIVYSLHEVYTTPEGLAKHWELGAKEPFFGDFLKVCTGEGNTMVLQQGAPAVQSLFPSDLDVNIKA